MSTFKRKKRRTHSEKISLEKQAFFDELCCAMQKVGIEVRIESGLFNGGLCIIDGNQYFYVNKKRQMDHNIELILNHLKSMNLESVFLSPKIRTYLE